MTSVLAMTLFPPATLIVGGKKISRETPDLLNFEKSMLIKEGAEKISKLDYPEFLAPWQS